MNSASLDTLLTDPRYLLHRVDFAAERLVFLKTTRQQLSKAPFIDGRTKLSDDAPIEISLKTALAGFDARSALPSARNRLILHTSFCGSTYLARLLDIAPRSFVYKEPQALIDLADRKVGHDDVDGGQLLADVLDLVLAQLRKSWNQDETALIKPSNWVNSLVPVLSRISDQTNYAIVDIDDRDFLVAVLSGGRERIVYVLRLFAHLQTGFTEYDRIVREASDTRRDPIQNAARLCMLALHLQRRLFDIVDPHRVNRINRREIINSPEAATKRAAAMLGVNLTSEEIAMSAVRNIGTHAKAPDRAFDTADRKRADQAVEQLYGDRIDAAIAWAADTLPPNPCLVKGNGIS